MFPSEEGCWTNRFIR